MYFYGYCECPGGNPTQAAPPTELEELRVEVARLTLALTAANEKINFLVKEQEDEDDPNY